MYGLDKKLFKQTLEQFEKAAQGNPDLMQKFNNLREKIKEKNQLNEIDLFELSTEYDPIDPNRETNKLTSKKVVEKDKKQTKTEKKSIVENESSLKPIQKGKIVCI